MRSPNPSPFDVLETVYFAAHDLMMLAQSPIGALPRPTPSSLILMRVLDKAGQPMTIAQIARRMGYSVQNASAIGDRLVQKHWVRYLESERKVRDKPVELTERGLWVLDMAIDRVGPHLKEATKILRSPKLRALLRSLRKLSEAAGHVDTSIDPVAELEGYPPRDEEEERKRRCYDETVRMSEAWGIPLDQLLKLGFHIPKDPDELPPAEESDSDFEKPS